MTGPDAEPISSSDSGEGCPFPHRAAPFSGQIAAVMGLESSQGEMRIRQLVETCQDSVLFIDRVGTILLANPSTCRMFGYSAEQLLGSDVRRLMAEPYATNHQSYIDHYERTGERRAIGRIRQVRALRSSGEEFPIELSVTLLADGGDGVAYGAFIRDVSEKVKLQGELMHRERAATVGTTASMLVHEIGNPLNNLALQLQALKRRVKKLNSGEDTLEKVDSCLGEIERLSRLVQEFRALSGRRRIAKKPLRMTELLESVLANLMGVSRGVTVEREFSDEQAIVMADADKMQQVVLNLCQNALEAMPQGGQLLLKTSRGDSDYVLEVHDTGEGVSPGIDVFEPFVTTKSDGTGLGLAICAEIVRSHEGTLTYDSLQQGTVFSMRLPLLVGEPV